MFAIFIANMGCICMAHWLARVMWYIEPCINYTGQVSIIREVPKVIESFLIYKEDEGNHDMMAIKFDMLVQLLLLHAT